MCTSVPYFYILLFQVTVDSVLFIVTSELSVASWPFLVLFFVVLPFWEPMKFFAKIICYSGNKIIIRKQHILCCIDNKQIIKFIEIWTFWVLWKKISKAKDTRATSVYYSSRLKMLIMNINIKYAKFHYVIWQWFLNIELPFLTEIVLFDSFHLNCTQ